MFKNSKGQLVTAEEAAADLNAQLDEAEKALQLEKYKFPLDERAAFEAHEPKERRLSPADQRTWFRRGAIADYDCKAIDDAWKAWQARAALQSVMEWTAAENVPDDRKLCLIRNAARAGLEQHSRKCPTCDSTGEADSGGVMPWAEAAMLPCPNCAQPSPAPEVVYAVFADNGNIRCWAMDRNHGALKALEIEGCTVVPLQSVAVAQAGQVPDALREAVEYLDENSLNQIGSGSKLHRQMRDALAAATCCTEEPFPSPQKQSKPCGECRLPEGERCDICGAQES